MNDIPQTNPIIPKNFAPVIKLFIIGFIILVLLIPVVWISTIIKERYDRKDNVAKEIASKWGADQLVSGPFICIPYNTVIYKQDNTGNEKTTIITNYLHITPETASITGQVESVEQHRGIFKVAGYKAVLDITSDFPKDIELSSLPNGAVLDWNNALVAFDLKDERGLKELTGNLNGKALTFNRSANVLSVSSPMEELNDLRKKNKYAYDNDSDEAITFKFEAKTPVDISTAKAQINLHLVLTGTQQLSFLTSAINETISLQGDWTAPSFTGDLLPDARTVDSKGFTASWHTNYLNTGNKQFWTSKEPTLKLSNLGVKFLIMVDAYQQTTRTLKYAVLFLLLTFMAFFFTETVTRQRIHPIQYLMVGCSLVIFYLLLLSVSEHLAFGWSYLIASFGVVMQISLYSYSILKTRKFALQVGSLLTAIYAFLYILLQLEDSALLVGSISLFVLLGVAMYVIRNVKWYNQE